MVNLQGTIEEQRKAHNDGCANRDKSYSTRVLKEGVLTQDEEIKTQPGLSAIPIRIYRRSGRQSSTSPLPAAVFFHGGGWILGDLQSDDFLCRKMAYELDHLVISVDYRLAPEHVFPAAIEDCYDAFKWVCLYLAHLRMAY